MAAALQSLLKRATKLNTSDLLTSCRAFCSKQIITPPQLPPFDYQPRPYNGPTLEEILADQKSFLGPSIYHKRPGKMQYLYDETGKRYLDAFAEPDSDSCGHCHPEVLKAIFEQKELLTGLFPYHLRHIIGNFAEALASKMPGNLK
ncbi:alanine-glyoxylate aminotransferase-like protein, partial [Trifolium medium]|nr:alanine-glyoxylate aminotransferase-like protein [Trifolium medium]